ncbi:MAG: BBP7 family outer membrane beta-barrel protein [Gemmataceae bacterium]
MRRSLISGYAFLLTASMAAAQPPAALTNLPLEEAAPAPNLGAATADWSMQGPRIWANAQYSLWWITPMNAPDLIQSVPSGIALQSVAGNSTLPAGSTTRYFPETRQLEFGAFSGVRGTVGVNFDRFGLEADYLYLPTVTKSSSLVNAGVPVSAAQSYIRAGTNTTISLLSSLEGQASGGIRSDVSSQLWGAELNARLPFYNFLTDTTDAVVGFRYLDLQERINLYTRSDLTGGNSVIIQDSIRTQNRFYGGQIGLNGKINGTSKGIGFDTTGKLAVGAVQQQAVLEGSNTFLTPGAAADTERGGLYARGGALGAFNRDKFAMIYEQTFNVTYNFTERTQVYIGYSIIWISSVMRPGEAIDQTINDSGVRYIAGAPAGSTQNRPAFSWNANDFWAQGLNFGLRLQY